MSRTFIVLRIKSNANKRNDVIKMQMIEFKNAYDVIEMFESRFEFANVTMSQFVRDEIECAIARENKLTFSFDIMFENIEMSLHMQCAFNYANATIDDHDTNDYQINVVARDNINNRTHFEIIESRTMIVVSQIVIDDELKIMSL